MAKYSNANPSEWLFNNKTKAEKAADEVEKRIEGKKLTKTTIIKKSMNGKDREETAWIYV